MIELFAVTDAAKPPPAPFRAVRRGGLSIVWKEARAVEEPTADDLWRHGEQLEQLMEDRDVLPVRYGTVVRDEDAAARVLDQRRGELAAGLERVRGAVELALRVRRTDSGAGEPKDAHELTGREYLGARAGGVRAAMGVHESLTAVARECIVQPSGDLLRVAYLVDRDDVEAFVALVRRLQDEHEDLALVCTGPWPPFSFAEGGGTR
jgi:Gas vesicle synthesis protein GvpL/GvpF